MKGKRWIWGIGALLYASVMIGGTSFWWFTWGPGAASENRPASGVVEPLDPAEVALGNRIYQADCAQCHGLQAEGAPDWRQRNPDGTLPPPPHDSTGHTWHHSDGLLYRIVGKGGAIYETPGFKSGMPAFGDHLSPEEVKAVITYLKSLWGPQERIFQAQVTLQDPFPSSGP